MWYSFSWSQHLWDWPNELSCDEVDEFASWDSRQRWSEPRKGFLQPASAKDRRLNLGLDMRGRRVWPAPRWDLRPLLSSQERTTASLSDLEAASRKDLIMQKWVQWMFQILSCSLGEWASHSKRKMLRLQANTKRLYLRSRCKMLQRNTIDYCLLL